MWLLLLYDGFKIGTKGKFKQVKNKNWQSKKLKSPQKSVGLDLLLVWSFNMC